MKFTIEVDSKTPIPVSSARWIAFINALSAASGVIPMTMFDVGANTQDPGKWTDYQYHFDAQDGRSWEQRVRFDVPGAEPSMTFESVNFWTNSEIQALSPVFSAVITLIQGYELTKLLVTVE